MVSSSTVRLFQRGLLLVALLVPLLFSLSTQAADFSYVQLWAGDPSGNKRAILVIDWADDRDCIVWGYRWNSGRVSGRTMLEAIKEVDPRLFERETGGAGNGFPATIYGLGYDRNGNGFVLKELPDDTSMPLDPDDSYREGWFSSGFWYIRQSEQSAGNPWNTSAAVESRNIDNGGALGARFVPGFFPVIDPPDPATCKPAQPTSTPTNTPTSTSTNTPTSTPVTVTTSTPTNTPTSTPVTVTTSTPTNTPTSTPVTVTTSTPTNTPTSTPVTVTTSTPTNTPTSPGTLGSPTPTSTPILDSRYHLFLPIVRAERRTTVYLPIIKSSQGYGGDCSYRCKRDRAMQ